MKKVAALFVLTATLYAAEVPQPTVQELRVMDPFGSNCIPTDIRTVLKVKPDVVDANWATALEDGGYGEC